MSANVSLAAEKRLAKERMSQGGGDQINDRVRKVSLPGQTRDHVAAFVGAPR